jgi:hypothetical protein
MPSFLASV